MLGMASCQQDVELDNPVVGGEVDFQLSVAAPELGTTRADLDEDGRNAHNSAYGAIDYLSEAEWAEVDLRYSLEVYDKADNYEDAIPVKDRMVKIVDKYEPVAFDLRLVPNREYHFVVFADFVRQGADATANINTQRELGLRHSIGDNLGQISIKYDAINDELTDAYFATKNITITNSAAQDIELKRPYGKVRVIATDLAELNTNVDPKAVTVEYDAYHPMAFNAVTGEIDGVYETKTYSYTYAELYKDVKDGGLAAHYYVAGYDSNTTTNVNNVERHTHMTLFTDYILAEDEQSSIHFTMTVNDKAGKEIKTTHFNTDIPVQRNHLTTIVGNVLTTATEINVTINDNFEDEQYDINAVLVSSARELQEAIDNYTNDQTIIFEADIEGNVVINQKVDKHYVIDGNYYKYDGVIEINGDARQADDDSVLLRNINFETAKKNINVIDANNNTKYGKNYNYAHNITVENCTFKLGEGSVALKMRQSKNLDIVNCTMTAGHSFAQLYGCNYVNVEGVEVNAKNGIAFGTSTNCVVEESTFVAEGYGFRAEPSGDITAKGIEITADKPVIVRKLTAGNYNLTINDSELVSNMGYQVIFTNGDDEGALVEPQGSYNFETNGEYLVFPGDTKIAYDAFSLQAAIDAAANGETIYVAGKCNCEGIFLINKDINIKGFKAGATITGKVGIIAGSDNTTFEGIKFVVNDETEKGAPNSQTNKNGIVVVYASAVGFTNCSFEGMTEAVYAIYNKDNNAEERITVQGCTFNGNRAIRTRANVKVDGCTFVGNTKPIVDVLGFGATDVKGSVQFTNNTADVEAPVAGVMLKVGNHEFRHVVFNVGQNDATINSIWRDAAHTHANLANFTREFTNDVKIINYDAEETYQVATANQLQLLLDDDVNVLNVEVTDAINYVGKGFEINRKATIDFQNNVLNAGSTASSYWYALEIYNGDVTIKNAKFTRAGVFAGENANVVFVNGTIDHKPERTSRYIFCAQSGATITIEDGTFKNDRAKNSFFWADAATIVVKGGNFGGEASNKKVVTSNGGEVIIMGGTFNFDPSAYVATGYKAVKNGSTWTVSAE